MRKSRPNRRIHPRLPRLRLRRYPFQQKTKLFRHQKPSRPKILLNPQILRRQPPHLDLHPSNSHPHRTCYRALQLFINISKILLKQTQNRFYLKKCGADFVFCGASSFLAEQNTKPAGAFFLYKIHFV